MIKCVPETNETQDSYARTCTAIKQETPQAWHLSSGILESIKKWQIFQITEIEMTGEKGMVVLNPVSTLDQSGDLVIHQWWVPIQTN